MDSTSAYLSLPHPFFPSSVDLPSPTPVTIRDVLSAHNKFIREVKLTPEYRRAVRDARSHPHGKALVFTATERWHTEPITPILLLRHDPDWSDLASDFAGDTGRGVAYTHIEHRLDASDLSLIW